MEKVNILVIFTTFHSWWMPELTLSQPNSKQDIILKKYPILKTHLTFVTIYHDEMNHRKPLNFKGTDWRGKAAARSLWGMGLESELEKRQIGGTRALETETWAWTTGCRKQRVVWGEAMRRRRAEYQTLWAENEELKVRWLDLLEDIWNVRR